MIDTAAQVRAIERQMRRNERGMTPEQKRVYRDGVRVQIRAMLNTPPSRRTAVYRAMYVDV